MGAGVGAIAKLSSWLGLKFYALPVDWDKADCLFYFGIVDWCDDGVFSRYLSKLKSYLLFFYWFYPCPPSIFIDDESKIAIGLVFKPLWFLYSATIVSYFY